MNDKKKKIDWGAVSDGEFWKMFAEAYGSGITKEQDSLTEYNYPAIDNIRSCYEKTNMMFPEDEGYLREIKVFSPWKNHGCISVVAKEIVINDTKAFEELVKMGDNFSLIDVNDGKTDFVELDISFSDLMK